jgi:aspartyl-tRNA(Asn)/glutamyl-tRNA(Gln) amidotransferase subunit C
MITRLDVKHIAELADIGITPEELDEFTHQFNEILDYFDLLDQVPEQECQRITDCNIWREDEIIPALSQVEITRNAPGTEEGFIRAPRVM